MEVLDNKINEEVQNKVIPGMTYAVVYEGNVDIGSVGYKSLVPNLESVSEDTIYDLASLSKVVVTLPLIFRMIDKGLVKFSDRVKKYIPEFKYDDITIYELLTHTSGLPADVKDKTIVSKEEMMNKVYSMEKEYETGSKVIYSDIGYIILGDLISRIYNKPLDEVAKEEVFIPLDMKDTSYNPSDKERCAPSEVTKERGVIKGIVHDEKACSLNGVAGHAGVFSTAKDLSNFVKMVLNNGIFNNKQFLSKELIDLWFKPLVYDSINEWDRSFSFIVGNNDIVIEEGEDIISFNGFTGPSISIDRKNNFGIALMTNRVHPTRSNTKISKERPIISHLIYEEMVRTKKK